MQKAKSRIKTQSKPRRKIKAPQIQLSLKPSKKYLKHLPLLLLSVPFYAGAYYIFTYIHPDKIKHFLIPNTYLPLQFTLFSGNFFLFSYLLLNTRRGLGLSLFLSFTLFLKLQLITNYSTVAAGILAIGLIIEALISLLKKD
jgi:hypothetical protein